MDNDGCFYCGADKDKVNKDGLCEECGNQHQLLTEAEEKEMREILTDTEIETIHDIDDLTIAISERLVLEGIVL